jgi:hypothetical protein
LKRIVLKACAYEPKDRYASAAEMLNDLNKLTGGTGIVFSNMIPDEEYREEKDDAKTVGPLFGKAKKATSINANVDEVDVTDGPQFSSHSASIRETQVGTIKQTALGAKKEKKKARMLKYMLIAISMVYGQLK